MSTGQLPATAHIRDMAAQICEHMATELNQDGMIESIRAIAETTKENLKGPYGTATRTYLPEYSHDDSPLTRISIYPTSSQQSRITRHHMQNRFHLTMVTFKRVDMGLDKLRLTAESDKVTAIAEEAAKLFEDPSGRAHWCQVQDGMNICECARWMAITRQTSYELAEVSSHHVLFVPIIHTWMMIRENMTC